MSTNDLVSCVSLVLGAFFFLAGTMGMLRFPDVYTRLHALTKADNLGLGLLVFGLALQAESWLAVAKLFLVWGLVMLASTTCCHLVAQAAWQAGISPWSRRDGQ
ncbi:MAG: monovalent cation/H(+) antiporter subunit G [Pirellulaceae bacterium]|nr:monovalent cation/H(+) antiporter subunit G [Pirellulaceae bacterium]